MCIGRSPKSLLRKSAIFGGFRFDAFRANVCFFAIIEQLVTCGLNLVQRSLLRLPFLRVFGLGVSVDKEYVVKKVDYDYFEEE